MICCGLLWRGWSVWLGIVISGVPPKVTTVIVFFRCFWPEPFVQVLPHFEWIRRFYFLFLCIGRDYCDIIMASWWGDLTRHFVSESVTISMKGKSNTNENIFKKSRVQTKRGRNRVETWNDINKLVMSRGKKQALRCVPYQAIKNVAKMQGWAMVRSCGTLNTYECHWSSAHY